LQPTKANWLRVSLPRKVSIRESKKAPDFALVEQEGKMVRLRDFRGKKVVLFFYVRDDTPGCTKEASSFRDGYRRLKAKDVVLLGISPDPIESHKNFADKYNLPYPLLVDPKAEVAKKFGVWGKKNMYGRTYFGLIRSTFIINEKGKVVKKYRRVKVDGHLDKVLKDLT
jgi:peroxiredoxin Q/BCP